MKKVLILAYDFPPYVSVGGLRPYSWYKYFKEFGVYPIVVTRQWENKYRNHLDYIAPSKSDFTIIEEEKSGTIIKTPYRPNLSNRLLLKYGEHKFRIIRKAITVYFEFMQFLFFIGPKSGLYYGAKEYLTLNKVDVIIATGDPFILFKYASTLSKKNKTPWIADYRDSWSQDKTGRKNSLLHSFTIKQEKKILKTCSKITTVSNFLISNISQNVNIKDFNLILNGFDSDYIKGNLKINQSHKILTITFAGTIYKWHPWKRFLLTLNEFVDETNNRIRVIFYGINIQHDVRSYINKINICENLQINFFERLPNEELLSELSKSNLVLLFNDYSILGTKIFDYLAIKRFILLCFSDDNESNKLKDNYYCINESKQHSNKLQEELIIKTNSGIIAKDSIHLKTILTDITSEFTEKGFIECNSIGIEDFSRKHQTKELARLIKNIINE